MYHKIKKTWVMIPIDSMNICSNQNILIHGDMTPFGYFGMSL